jgi:OmcA/MtrC family decaheme c-type cytochrome
LSVGGYRSRCVAGSAGAFAATLLVLAPGCKRPAVGAGASSATVAGPEVSITSSSVDGTGHVVVGLTITAGGAPLSREAALALAPTFTLAAVSTHPVDGLSAWKSLLLTGKQTVPALPPSGPGTPPAAVIANAQQPGSEKNGTFSGGDGEFTYVFANAVPGSFDPAETLRVGVYLAGAEGTPLSCATRDFRPAGGAPAPRDTVLDANCNRCHGFVRHHDGRRVGVKLCLTCHTWQNADPDTADPAALYASPPPTATDPNPLELGRLVHRIHRGKDLPTLYTSTSTAAAPTLPSATALPLPYTPFRPGLVPRNLPVVGRRFSVVGEMGHEVVYGEVRARPATDPNRPPVAAAGGVLFPRDLRDCGVCHEGAPQAYEVLYGVSRRTCSGCHPEIWFQSTAITDTVHFAHPGGPQADDAECQGCHIAATATQPKVYAPIADIHVMPHRSPRYSRPVLEIVSVENLRPGAAPTVKFKLYDRVGTISPPNAPTPATEAGPSASPIPRAFQSLSITMGGPTAPGYGGFPILSSDAGNPSPLTLTADASGVFTYAFVSTLPATASGTWAVGMEGRRRINTALYDTATDTFRWPYTGEAFFSTESPHNPVVYVDTATGTFTPGVPSTAVPRRTVVAQAKCEKCHERIFLHGMLRNQVAYCLICHTPNRTDWSQRPKVNGNVNLAATYDGIEERSIEFKVMIHRLHTGKREGAAALDALEPFLIYGVFALPYFFDEGLFPDDLRNCTLCHEGKSYLIESIPADAPWTAGNESPTIRHQGTRDHPAGEPATPPIQAACLGCHATGPTRSHVARYTASGVEQCAQCHVRGAFSVEVVHGLSEPGAAPVAATFSSIAEKIFVPRCASAACHGGSTPANFPQVDAQAYDALFEVPSQQASLNLVEPFAPERSYLLLKLRGDGGTVGGIATPMPIGDAALSPSDIAAVEAWIANGAPND